MFALSGLGVRLGPEWVIGFARNGCSIRPEYAAHSAISRKAPLVARDALRDQILNLATSPLALAVDIPFKAAMLGLEWPKVRRLFDERERRRRLAEWAGRD